CVPADRPAAGHFLYRRYGARDTVAFLGLIQTGMPFPSPAMGRNLVAAAHCVLRQQREPLDGAATRTHRRRCAVLTEHLHDPPPAGTRTVFKMTVDCRIGSAGEALFDFVHRLVLAIPVVNRKLRASKLTTMDTATRAPPGQRGSGGEPAYPSRSRVLAIIRGDCGIQHSSPGARWIIAHRRRKTTAARAGPTEQPRYRYRATMPLLLQRCRTRKAQEPGR